MLVIVTGGIGIMGRALATDLAAGGYEIVLLSRNPQHLSGMPAGVRVVRWDGCSAEGWGVLANGATAIVNLAGESLAAGRWSAANKQRIIESRVNAGKAVVEAATGAAIKPEVVIQASGVGYYGPHGDEEVTERDGPGNDFPARVTLQWEPSTEPVRALGVRHAIIRTGPVLTLAGGALPRLLLPFKLFVGGPLGSGRQWFPWIHMADQVAAIRYLIETPAADGPFNLCAPNPLRNATFAEQIGRAMKRPSWLPVPSFALRLLFGEMATVLLEGQRAVPHRLSELGFKFRFPDAGSALRNLLAP